MADTVSRRLGRLSRPCLITLVAALGMRLAAAPASEAAVPQKTVTYRRGGIQLCFRLPDPLLEVVEEADGNSYVAVELPGYGSSTELGCPRLPVVDTCVETWRRDPLPRVRLTDCRWHEVRLMAPVLPAQEPIPKVPGALAAQRFRVDPHAYAGEGFRHSKAGQAGSWYRITPFRKARVNYFKLEFFLHAFDPARLMLKYPREFTVALSWTDGPTLARPSARPHPRPVRIVNVELSKPEDIRALLRRGFDVADKRDNVVTIYASAGEMAELRDAGFEPAVVPNEAPQKARALKRHKGRTLGEYHSHESLSTFLAELAAEYPALCRVESIGTSIQGRDIWAVKISDNVANDEEEPEVRVAATIHGDEPPGMELCLYFMDHVLSRYEEDARVTSLIDSLEMWFIPLLNPDGLEAGARHNAQGIDLNQAFPDRIQDPVNSPEGRPPEAAAVMRFCAERHFSLACNFHTGAAVVTYPFDSNESGDVIYTATEDDELFQRISSRYAELNPVMRASAIFPGGITNGAARSVVYGGLQDWSYVWNATNEVAVELWGEKWPASGKLEVIWRDNRASLMAYLETALTALSGTIRDSASGEIVPEAQITVAGIDHTIGVNPRTGRYHRMLVPGTYTLTAWAPGYEPCTVSDVQVADGATTELDVALQEQRKGGGETVLVVAHDVLAAGAHEMVDYYGSRGLAAELLTFTGIGDAHALRTLIRNEYEAQPFTFLLLLGDTDTLQPFDLEGHISDMPYSLLDPGEGINDVEGRDVVLGRLPFRSNDAVAIYRQKLNDFLSERRRTACAWVSQGKDGRECSIAEGTHQWVIDNVLGTDDCTHVLLPCDTGRQDDFCEAINERIDIATYSGHGGAGCWMRWDFCIDDLSCLTNAGHPPIVFSHACDTGRFEHTMCFGEAWIMTDMRAVAFVGSSDGTLWDEDDWLEKRIFEVLCAEEPVSLGEALLEGLAEVTRLSGEGTYYHEIYHILGDPSLRVAGDLEITARVWEDGGNEILEAGEQGDLRLTIRNLCEQAVTGIKATLSTESDRLSIRANQVTVGDLDLRAERKAVFPVQISGDCPTGHAAVFRLLLTYDGGEVPRDFTLTVHELSRVSGQVKFDATGDTAPGVMVTAAGTERHTVETGPDGGFTFSVVEGTYTITATLDGYFPEETTVLVPPDRTDLVLSLGWAEATVAPAQLALTCAVGEEQQDVVTMRNVGTRPLTFRTSYRGGGGGTCPVNGTYSVCDEPGEPPFAWVPMVEADVIHQGTSDDQAWGPIPLAFSFPFCGYPCDHVFVSSNGLCSFRMPMESYENISLPSPGAPPLILAALWDDLVVPRDGEILMLQDEERCVIEWRTMEHYDGSPAFSFQAMLFHDGSIQLQYQNVPWTRLSPTVGVQGGTAERGVTVPLDDVADNLALLCFEEDGDGGETDCSGTYSLVTADEPGGPTLQWVDMAAATIVFHGSVDDAVWGPYPVAVPFTYYDQDVSEVFISSNGFITFTRPDGSYYQNSWLPSAAAPSFMVAALWDDLMIPGDGSVLMLTGPDRTVIEYREVAHLAGSPEFSFQIILDASGEICFQYHNLPWDHLTPTVGIQDGTGTNGLVAHQGDLANNVICFRLGPQWINVEPAEGEVPPGGSVAVTVAVSAPDSQEPIETSVIFRTNSPREAVVRLPVTVHVLHPGWYFLRGDANQDGRINISDPLATLRYLFSDLRVPCVAALDVSDDGAVQIADAISLLMYLFLSGPSPSAPFPECGYVAKPPPGLSCDQEPCRP